LSEFGWARGEAAGVYSLFIVVCGIGSLGGGALSDRFGPGRVIAAGGTILAVGLLICSRLTELWQFYLSYGVIVALGVSTAGWTASVTMVNRWFAARLGLALGIASAGIGAGIMVVVPLVQILIINFGWRSAFIWHAGLVFSGLVLVGLFVLRGRPEDLGQQVDGVRSSGTIKDGKPQAKMVMEVVDAEWAGRDWTIVTAAKTIRLWMLVAVKILGSIATQMIFVHQVVYLVDGGYDRVVAASIVGLIGLLSAPVKIFWGWAADNIGREMTNTLGCAAMIIAIGLLTLTRVTPSMGILYFFALFFAMGYGVSAPLWPIITYDLFAGRHFGSVYGFVSLFSGWGSALGVWLGGYVFDLTGSYALAFEVAVIGAVISAVMLWIVAPRKVRRVRRIR
ncbi:MAG: MFS transporter, partial [Pseudomonadota bacterium]